MSGQVGHTRPAAPSLVVPGIAVLLAAVLLAAIALATIGSPTASARTALAEGAGATATLADGTSMPLEVGDEVPQGATVTASAAGAVLRTRDRDVLLSPAAQVTVVDGARQVLHTGFVMVDARRGPEVEVETAAAVVTTPAGAVARIEPGALLRVGAFAGEEVRVRAAGRRTTVEVEALGQVQVPVGGLPSRVTPLALTGDAYERRVAAELVAADRALTELGRTLDSAGEQGPAVLTALRTSLPSLAEDAQVRPAGQAQASAAPAVPRSEPALAFLLAAAPDETPDDAADLLALPAGDSQLAERYTRARDLRASGGSWGVVAQLVDSSVPAVGSLLDRLLSPLVVVAGGAPAPSDVLALLVPAAPAPAGPSAGVPTAPPAVPSPPAPPPGPDAPPSPPPPSEPPPGPFPPPLEDPVGTVLDTVEVVVETVVGLLPDPPAPAPAPDLGLTVPPLPG